MLTMDKTETDIVNVSNSAWVVELEYDQDNQAWAVWASEIPGANSCGNTREEALENIKEAISLMLED